MTLHRHYLRFLSNPNIKSTRRLLSTCLPLSSSSYALSVVTPSRYPFTNHNNTSRFRVIPHKSIPTNQTRCLFSTNANKDMYDTPNPKQLFDGGLPILQQVQHHADSNRILCYDHYHHQNDDNDDPSSYREVLNKSRCYHSDILSRYYQHSDKHKNDVVGTNGARIAFLCEPGSQYVAIQWACWSTGSIAVPLCISHKSDELKYVLEDSDPFLIIDGTKNSNGNNVDLDRAVKSADMMDRLIHLSDMSGGEDKGEDCLGQGGAIASMDEPAMIIYTSGTTGSPKGVLSTHRNIHHQVTDLVKSWKWTKEDHSLHFLPLHHVHGIINKLCCAVYVGASIEFIKFDANRVWRRLADPSKPKITIFMAVPTIYAKLIETSRSLPTNTLQAAIQTCQSSIRVMISGSAALPTTIMSTWKGLTHHTILERYGMTEFAMALSNEYDNVEHGRIPGFVGRALPSVEVMIVNEETGQEVVVKGGDNGEEESGELRVKGPTVFKEYWKKPNATREAFDEYQYFKTGDIAAYSPKHNSYRILGRSSVDIIKCGGYKLSALEIERVLLEHEDLEEVAILGLPDCDMWGERVGMIARMKTGQEKLTLEGLRTWCGERMSRYKIPSRLVVLEEDIPKNAMGKISKKQLLYLFDEEEE